MKITLDGNQYSLTKKLGEGNFATVYATQHAEWVAKVSMRSNPKAYDAFKIESTVLNKISSPSLIKIRQSGVTNLEKQEVCVLIMENCEHGSLIDLLVQLPGNKPQEGLVLTVFRDVLLGLKAMHDNGYIHRDVKMENVLLSREGNFKLCDFGSTTTNVYEAVNNVNRYEIIEDMEKNTTPFYRAPEYIDTYAGFPINQKVDVFALGVLLFIFCFQKPPFESGLAAVNSQYFIPKDHQFSDKLVQLIRSLFTVNPKNRPSVQDVLNTLGNQFNVPHAYSIIKPTESKLQMPNIQQYFKSVDNVYIEKKENPLGLMDQLKRYLNTLSKKTEAWVIQSTVDDLHPPRSEDIKHLVVKAWMKRQKIPLFYKALQQKVLMAHPQNPRIMFKTCILIHNYIKMGPPEVLQSSQISAWTVLRQLIENQSHIIKVRPSLETRLILVFSEQLRNKLQLVDKNKYIFEASYSLSPLLSSLNLGNFLQPIETQLFDDLLLYWSECLSFSLELLQQTSLWPIQTIAIIQLVDEVYQLMSMILHLWVSVKQSTRSNQDIDQQRLIEWMEQIDNRFEVNYLQTQVFFNKCVQLPEFKVIAKQMPQLPDAVIAYVKNTQLNSQQQSLNPQSQIIGIGIPMSYSVKVNNLQSQLLSMAKFDKPKQDIFSNFMPQINNNEEQMNDAQYQWVEFTGSFMAQQPSNELEQKQQENQKKGQIPVIDMSESHRTDVEPAVLSQIIFHLKYNQNDDAQSGRFNIQQHQQEFQQCQSENLVQKLNIQPQQYTQSLVEQVDLLNDAHQPKVNLDLLDFEDDLIHVPQDVDFNQNQISDMRYPSFQQSPNYSSQFQQPMQVDQAPQNESFIDLITHKQQPKVEELL